MSTNDRRPLDRAGNSADDRTDRRPDTPREQEPPRPEALASTVVRYDHRPDRCTVYPRNCSDEEKLTTWLTADLSTFVDLEHVR